MPVRFSKRFEKDYDWFLRVSDHFNFDGCAEHINKNGEKIIIHSVEGLSAKECFYLYDSVGQIVPTKEPLKLKRLLVTKGSVNLHIKMYAKDRAKGYLPKIEFLKICSEFRCPEWFLNAVENQKKRYY